MGQQAISGIAALVALTFLVLALSACSTTEQARGPLDIAPVEATTATPEFHGAHVGEDALRDRLVAE
jgi:hypothetical protein